MPRWQQTFEVVVETEFRPDVHTQKALGDAMADAACELALAHDCGDVRVTLQATRDPEAVDASSA